MSIEKNEGGISEWNDGNFKNIRFHQGSTLSNTGRNDPFRRFDNKWGYELWFAGVDILFVEGLDKYDEKEITKVKELKKVLNELIKKGIALIIFDSLKRKKVNINVNNWEKFKEVMEDMEELVRIYNNKHGYSTRSTRTKGMFG